MSWYLIERVDWKDDTDLRERLETINRLTGSNSPGVNKQMDKFRKAYYAEC